MGAASAGAMQTVGEGICLTVFGIVGRAVDRELPLLPGISGTSEESSRASVRSVVHWRLWGWGVQIKGPRQPAEARVLIVEAIALLRGDLTRALRGAGMDVVGAVSSAEESVAVIERERPEIMLLGLELPGMSGLEFLKHVHRLHPSMRVVVLAQSPTDADILTAMAVGAWGCLTHDIAPDGLSRALQGVMNGHLAMGRPMAASLMRRLATLIDTRPERLSAADLSELTERETQVLELVADGLTDRQIAVELGVSMRTVEKHVSNTLHKLGCRERREAAARYRPPVRAQPFSGPRSG